MLEVRWLGRVNYRDAFALQHRLFEGRTSQHLLFLEHNHIYTLGIRAQLEHLLIDPATVGADCMHVDRGGDITYHGPGQLIGYPIVDVALRQNSTPEYIFSLEQLIVDTLRRFGIDSQRNPGYPGVWVKSSGSKLRKIAAIGVRISRGRSMHGFALNVAPNMDMFRYIVPCGIADFEVTSMANEGVNVTLEDVVAVMAELAPAALGFSASSFFGTSASIGYLSAKNVDDKIVTLDMIKPSETLENAKPQDRRLASAGISTTSAVSISSVKPEWVRLKTSMGKEFKEIKSTMRGLELVTVCEEAGCPNIFECWSQGTATFMINGANCTRSCGFCLINTEKPLVMDVDEPRRVAEAVVRMKLEFAVVTAVARDDLDDGGVVGFVETIRAIRAEAPGVGIEVLIPDLRGNRDALKALFDERPEVLNHNIETVLRLQRAVRPQASYARSLSVLAGSVEANLVTKSGIIVGMGETIQELRATLRDLSAVGVEIVTIGQYLRPTRKHLPVARWYLPSEFAELKEYGHSLGIRHIESSPNTRSSYHAKSAGLGLSVMQ